MSVRLRAGLCIEACTYGHGRKPHITNRLRCRTGATVSIMDTRAVLKVDIGFYMGTKDLM